MVDPDEPDELPLRPAEPLLPVPVLLDDEPTPLLLPDEPDMPELPVPVEPLPEEPEPLAKPLVVPEVDEPVLDALFSRAWPVAGSLQCVAADTSALPLADGDVDD